MTTSLRTALLLLCAAAVFRAQEAGSGAADAGPFAERLFRETGTAVAPGRFFGSPAHFRLAFGGDPARVREGLASIGRCLDGP
jgi:aspartate/methionine/tyrosine aminotransferase